MTDNSPTELEETLLTFQKEYGNSFTEWKNKDYDYAQTLPEAEQEQLRPELVTTLQALMALTAQEAREQTVMIATDYLWGLPWDDEDIEDFKEKMADRIATLTTQKEE